MAPIVRPSHLANPLTTSTQLETCASDLDGVPADLQASVRFGTARLLQAAGILLRLPQEIVAHAIVLVDRFRTGPDGGSLLECDSKDVAAAALYLSAKPSAKPVSPRQTIVVFEYLSSLQGDYAAVVDGKQSLDQISTHLSEGKYEATRARLYQTEAHILRVLGFQTQVALPYALCINYMQTLDVFQDASSAGGTPVAKRAFAHLNAALLSPQMLYLTHQPCTLATAAIYLAGREVGVKLPETEWWEVFDVDREELGFVVVALLSVGGFAAEEKKKWSQRSAPLTVEDVKLEMERRAVLEAGE